MGIIALYEAKGSFSNKRSRASNNNRAFKDIRIEGNSTYLKKTLMRLLLARILSAGKVLDTKK
jgi:hypothetical protein